MLALLKCYGEYANRPGQKADQTDYYEKIVQALMNEAGFDRMISEEFLNEFQLNAYDLLNKIRRSIEDDMQDVGIYIHQLKGLAGNLRVREIAEYTLALENELRSKGASQNNFLS